MPEDLFSVQDKVVVITGGLGQLGRQFSLTLAERGAKVAIFDVLVDEQRVAERFGIQTLEEAFLFLPVDVTSRASIEGGLREVNARWGVPHALINNAAVDAPPDSPGQENGPFESYPESSWDRVMEVNTKGVFLCSQMAGTQMASAGRGSIINICSIYAIVSPDQRLYEYRRTYGSLFFKPAAYSASKAALVSLTRYLATYWASKNVRVNSLTFGGVFNEQDEQFIKNYSSRVPLGRLAREDEYNGAVIFLVSEASSYVTGANIIIDGGWTAW